MQGLISSNQALSFNHRSDPVCDAIGVICGFTFFGVLSLSVGGVWLHRAETGAAPAHNVSVNTTSSESQSDSGLVTGGIVAISFGILLLIPLFCVIAMQAMKLAQHLRSNHNESNFLNRAVGEATPLIVETGENSMSRSNSPTLFHIVTDKRIETIEKQRQLEEAMQSGDSAVFLTSDMLTPLFIDPNVIQFDAQSKLFKLKEASVLPEGLMPDAKANDPAQLSTVLGRTISMRKMLDQGVSIIVMTVNATRQQVSDSAKIVDDQEIQKIKSRYTNFQHRIVVLQDALSKMYETIFAATYFHGDTAFGIRASQIHKSDLPNTDCVVNPDVGALQVLLEANEISIQLPNGVKQSEYSHA